MKPRTIPEEAAELRELIRVEVELFGLTAEDVEYLIKNGLARILRLGGDDYSTIPQA